MHLLRGYNFIQCKQCKHRMKMVINLKKLPIGIQTFRKIIEGGYIYADKTQFIYKLIQNASSVFLSRPRRFGKSLLLDTMAEMFGGDKELFKGLWIYDTDYAFKKHPVIRIDFSCMDTENPEELKESIISRLEFYFTVYGLVSCTNNPVAKFEELIWKLKDKYGERVVVLVDEYDKPVLDHITDFKTADANRQVIKRFFGILKGMDAYLRFTFFTGVSKFTKTSLFSELNNLSDITMAEDYVNICGFTNNDINALFDDHITEIKKLPKFASLPETGEGSLLDNIYKWYDGYSWDGENRVFNPFSLLNFMDKKEILSYWFTSGSPGFLVKLMKQNPDLYLSLDSSTTNEIILDAMDIDKISPVSLMFQTGYLTVRSIKRQEDNFPIYELKIPNDEVRVSFNQYILAGFTETEISSSWNSQQKMLSALKDGEPEKLEGILCGLFASIPYEIHVDTEAYYQSLFYCVMQLIGFNISAEVSTSHGRADGILELPRTVYVMEFKYKKGEETDEALHETAAKAMEQINQRGYANRYSGSAKEVIKIAVGVVGRSGVRVIFERGL